jgi:poly(3-hydroxybutyrate) depolymerase
MKTQYSNSFYLRDYLKYHSHILIAFLLISISSCGDDDTTPPTPPTPNPPTASFTASATGVLEGDTVNFSDTSTGNPISWSWTFEGGSPETSTEQNPNVTYNSQGIYKVSLTVTNEDGSDTKEENNFITCEEDGGVLETGLDITVDGLSRIYDIYKPSQYSSQTNLPVIIDLHGTTSNSTQQRYFSDFMDIADENKIVMVWPQALQLDTCLNNELRWNANVADSPNDVNFISSLIDEIITNYNVDSNRIYIAGLSNGGYMAYSIACELSDKVAAIASVAGTMSYDTIDNFCNPTRAIPVLQIHGTNDQIVDFNGYTNCEGGYASIDEVITYWRDNAGCNSSFDEYQYPDLDTTDESTAKRYTYQDCNNYVQLIVIENGGHVWPGSTGFEEFYSPYADILFPLNFDIDASHEIWNFFKDKSL